MANYKVVDAEQLDADLAVVADAIREKGGTSDALAFPNGMADAVRAIEGGGEEVFVVENTGVIYTAHIKHITNGVSCDHKGFATFRNATEMVSFETDLVGNGYCFANSVFHGCTKLENVIFSRIKDIVTPIDKYYGCTSLKCVQYGSIGNPMTRLSDGRLLRGTSHEFDLIIYVDAEKIEDIPADITDSAPWGNANVNIIYRNSTTGEVITA